ncbi:MAG: hypothetical protein SGI91_13780 [Alphaproteobacteria bacterium]|jgi:hypothetical protein|nr:hypothetical protein [Alphaproteobacteria bacterium]
MGSIHLSPLADLVRELARAGEIRDFVETGTYVGGALGWASRSFERVWTVELNPEFQRQAKANNPGASNITYLLGDSASELPKIVSGLKGPALFWLDAHAGAGYFADHDICPLVDELETVLASPYDHCILVDDARAFLAPPPPPFDYRKWPSLDQIFAAIAKRPGYNVVTIADVLIMVPEKHRQLVAQFCFAIRPQI